jgi:aldehyde:ferredoxin oxidoreductase
MGVGDFKDGTLPKRLLSEDRDSDPEKRTFPPDKTLPRYYRLRWYDADGVPSIKKLKRLKIKWPGRCRAGFDISLRIP